MVIRQSPPTVPIDRPGPLWAVVLILAAPVWGQKLLDTAVNLTDRLLLGRFFEAVTPAHQAAQTTAGYLTWFFSSYAVLVTAGATAVVARLVGAGDRPGARHATHQALLLALVVGVAGGLAGLFGGRGLTGLLHPGSPEAADLAQAYLGPQFATLPALLVEQVGVACLVGAGDTVAGMWVLSGVALINVPLALGFFALFGFVGISAGTAVTHTLGATAILVVLARGRAGLQLRRADFRPDRALLARLLRVGVPAGIDSLSVMAGQLWFLRIVQSLGDVPGAAHGIALQWEGLGYQTGSAFGVAAMALVGQNLGAGRPASAARSGWTAFALGGLAMCGMGAVFYVLAEPMFLVFFPQPGQRAVVAAGVPVLRLVAWAMPAVAAWCVLMPALRGAGDTRWPLLFSWVGFLGIRIPLAYWLADPEVLGLMGAWYAMCADLYVRAAAFVIRFASGRWQRVEV
jgi:putative MATE family efflux protein